MRDDRELHRNQSREQSNYNTSISSIQKQNDGFLSQVGSVQQVRDRGVSSLIIGSSTTQNDNSNSQLLIDSSRYGVLTNKKKRKRRGPEVPHYLREDFPNRNLHLARQEAKRMFDQSEQATVYQFNTLLDKAVHKNQAEMRQKREREYSKDASAVISKKKLKEIKEINSKILADENYKQMFGSIDLKLRQQNTLMSQASQLNQQSSLDLNNFNNGKNNRSPRQKVKRQMQMMKNIEIEPRIHVSRNKFQSLSAIKSTPQNKDENFTLDPQIWQDITGGAYMAQNTAVKNNSMINFILYNNKKQSTKSLLRYQNQDSKLLNKSIETSHQYLSQNQQSEDYQLNSNPFSPKRRLQYLQQSLQGLNNDSGMQSPSTLYQTKSVIGSFKQQSDTISSFYNYKQNSKKTLVAISKENIKREFLKQIGEEEEMKQRIQDIVRGSLNQNKRNKLSKILTEENRDTLAKIMKQKDQSNPRIYNQIIERIIHQPQSPDIR
eukprot:403359098